MLPILEFPSVVTRYANRFDSLFHNSQQQQHFREYVSGLILADKATVDAINSLFVDSNDQSALNKYLTQATWDEQALNARRVQLELESLQRDGRTARAGYLIIDDTLAHHVGQSIQFIAKLWDHSEHQYVWAHNLVTSFYVNGTHRFPVNFRLWIQFQEKVERKHLHAQRAALGVTPTREQLLRYVLTLITFQSRQQHFRTKHKLGQQLVEDAVTHGLPFSTVLFDGWYLHLDLIETIEQKRKDWIGGFPRPPRELGRALDPVPRISQDDSRERVSALRDSRHAVLGFYQGSPSQESEPACADCGEL